MLSFSLSLSFQNSAPRSRPSRRMLRRLAHETGHALRSSFLASSTTTLLSEASASSTFSSSFSSAAAASRIANSLLASSSGRSSFSTFFSAPAQQAAAGLADFIEPPLKEGEKRVAGEFLIRLLFFLIDGNVGDGRSSRPRPLLLTSSNISHSSLQPHQPNHPPPPFQAAPGQRQTSAKSPGTTSTPCGSSF